jgi:hypothetical protein
MKRFRDQLQNEGLTVKRVQLNHAVTLRDLTDNDKAKTANKRLSLENAKASTPASTPQPSNRAVSPPRHQTPTPRTKSTFKDKAHEVEHIDITEEVNRRLQESRLRRLVETPGTAHKRKRNAFEEPRSESGADTGEDMHSHNGYSGSDFDGTPTKRLKSTGTFEQVLKRKEAEHIWGVGEEPMEQQSFIKRRRT